MSQKSDARREPGALKAERLYKAHNTPQPCRTQQAGRSVRETDDDYHGVIARLSDNHRPLPLPSYWTFRGNGTNPILLGFAPPRSAEQDTRRRFNKGQPTPGQTNEAIEWLAKKARDGIGFG